MSAAQWVAIVIELVGLGVMLLIVRSYRRDIEDLQADRDEDTARIADLRADMAADLAEMSLIVQQQRTRLTQLAQHVTASEPPSSGRHAHTGELRNAA